MANNIFKSDFSLLNEPNCLNTQGSSISNNKVLIYFYEKGFTFNNIISSLTSPNLNIQGRGISPSETFPNADFRILTYIYIPEEKYYKFKVTYSAKYSIYINNYKYKILDNSVLNNTSNDDIIKKGIYLLCMDIETSNQKFKLEYAIDKTNNWQPIDNLLLNDSKCLNQIDFKFLIDSFLLSSLNYCEKNTGTKECRQFYNNLGNLENNIIDYYNDLGKISKYPNTIDGKYGDWSINDSVWNSIDVNIVGNCGKGIVRQRVRNYEDAL